MFALRFSLMRRKLEEMTSAASILRQKHESIETLLFTEAE